MPTCLVAGSTGLVGCFLVKKLANNGNKVFALTRKEEFCYRGQSTDKRITEQLGIGKGTIDKYNVSNNSKKQKLASDP